MRTEFGSFFWWDPRNGQESNNSPFLYGRPHYGDRVVVTSATSAGPADRYPALCVCKLPTC